MPREKRQPRYVKDSIDPGQIQTKRTLGGSDLLPMENRNTIERPREGFMPLYSYFEVSCKQIGWRDIGQLLRASLGRSGALYICKDMDFFHISIEALSSESTRPDWIHEAQELGLSDGFIAIAMRAAEKGARKICIGLDTELDPELPMLAQPCSEEDAGTSAGASPNRYLIAEDWGHIFLDRYGEERVRWIAEWGQLKIVKVQVYDRRSKDWDDAAPSEFFDVVESIEQNGYMADPEEWGLVPCDEPPSWAAD
jgi:hypothetical protein